jgi:hypothetical protein
LTVFALHFYLEAGLFFLLDFIMGGLIRLGRSTTINPFGFGQLNKMENQLNMSELTTFLSNPVVGVIGYTLSLIAAIIAIYQALAKGKALKAIKQLNLQITTIRLENNDLRLSINKTENNNEIIQGEKSQYFQDNSGSVNIDNRG